jgi:pSer/pThr/pTyr-binding forkhead associated (FHA) protein
MGVFDVDRGHCGASGERAAIVDAPPCPRHRGVASRVRVLLDCDRVNELLLRFPGPPATERPLGTGMHGIAPGTAGLVEAREAPVRICVDRRGVWLHVDEGALGVHVNGRPVQRLAMLRAGDVVFVDGADIALVGPIAPTDAAPASPRSDGDPRVVLRGVGGRYHGRSFTLERPRLVGRSVDADIRLDDPEIAERHARLELHGDFVHLRDLGSAEGSVVNGQPVRDALLRPGDQVVFDAHHRFVVEAPGHAASPVADPLREDEAIERVDGPALAPSTRRLPWLLLAALLIAAALSILLLFGSPA